MFAKVYSFAFDDLADAKDAAAEISRELSSEISEHNLAGLSVYLDKKGLLTINVKFDDFDDVQEFEKSRLNFASGMVERFGCTSDETTALTLFSFEREASTTELEL